MDFEAPPQSPQKEDGAYYATADGPDVGPAAKKSKKESASAKKKKVKLNKGKSSASSQQL